MSTVFHVLVFSLAGGLLSLIGGLFLVANRKRAEKLSSYATPFAAGALLAAAFFDLLYEATLLDNRVALLATLGGLLLFFMLERFLRWFHHHHSGEKDHRSDINAPLIIIGDTVHNFIDGIAIAAGFLISVPAGIIVTIAVAAHEIPQEIGDFGLLLKKGMKPKKVLIANALSAVATVVAAVSFFYIGQATSGIMAILLGVTAGFFIYIAVSDIIPMIHEHEAERIAGPQTVIMIAGVLLVGAVTTTLHSVIETSSHQHQNTEIQQDHEQEDSHGHGHEAHDAHSDEH